MTQDQDARGNARAVKQLWAQADDCVDDVIVEEPTADTPLVTAAKKHTVGHDGGDHAIGAGDREHVLDEHEVGLLAGLGGGVAVTEPLGGERDGVLTVVQRERRVGDDAVEAHQFAALDVSGVFEGAVVVVAQVGVGDAMQQQVHLADGPYTAIFFLAGECEIATVSAGFLDIVLGQDQHAARPATRVVHAHAFPWVGDLHHQSNHRAGV